MKHSWDKLNWGFIFSSPKEYKEIKKIRISNDGVRIYFEAGNELIIRVNKDEIQIGDTNGIIKSTIYFPIEVFNSLYDDEELKDNLK